MYTLELTTHDISTISFVGRRYSWATALYDLEFGVNKIEESEAWEIKKAFEEGMEGGQDPFPMLLSTGDLYVKLMKLWDEIV